MIASRKRQPKAERKIFTLRRPFLVPAFGARAAAAAAVAIAFVVFQSHSQPTRITAELIDAHVRSLQPGHLTDVISTGQHTVKPWLDGKLEFVPPVSDFSQQGFPLVGGRLGIIDGRDVPTLVYSRPKHVTNVFVWPYRCDSIMLRMSRFSRISIWCSTVPLTARSTMARAKSSARITWLGNSARNAG